MLRSLREAILSIVGQHAAANDGALVISLDANGNLNWARSIENGGSAETAWGVVATSDGGFCCIRVTERGRAFAKRVAQNGRRRKSFLGKTVLKF